jgi:hypothetical protein
VSYSAGPHVRPSYRLAASSAAGKDKDGKDRISLSTIYRLNRNEGRVANFDGELLEALCDVFGVEPGRLLEREGVGKKVKRRGRKA